MCIVGVVDIGISNIGSVLKALETLGMSPIRVSQSEQVAGCDKIILPGVGSFPEGMRKIKEVYLDEALDQFTAKGNMLLGICLGMQLLASKSVEGELTQGLCYFPCDVEKFKFCESLHLKVPHIGWNNISLHGKSRLLEGMGGNDFYFCHSFHMGTPQSSYVSAITEYGYPFSSVVELDNVFGVQFHPEKSQSAGLSLLKRFLDL